MGGLQGWETGYNLSSYYSMLQSSFGWIASAGYTPPGSSAATQFPVIVGEFGAQLYLNSVSFAHQTLSLSTLSPLSPIICVLVSVLCLCW